MINPKAPRGRIHIDLFALNLTTLSIGWLVMGASEVWKFSIWLQMILVMIVALLWTIVSYLILNEIQKVASGQSLKKNKSSVLSDTESVVKVDLKSKK